MKECTIEGCSQPVKARGLCSTHHQRMLRNGCPHTIRKKMKKEPKQCQWVNCQAPSVSKGFCSRHYYVYRTTHLDNHNAVQ
ncbi:hypothetical protein CF651_24025 [Paenibacillus rigui]|uniref:Uncharacterized protein n=1 Tax=Paenibacillus rigui TaxID=554312 RepID=A0A229UK47_9BACL|nr:hypothetical protein CF651_24025 [Paenibacillus rigui]